MYFLFLTRGAVSETYVGYDKSHHDVFDLWFLETDVVQRSQAHQCRLLYFEVISDVVENVSDACLDAFEQRNSLWTEVVDGSATSRAIPGVIIRMFSF